MRVLSYIMALSKTMTTAIIAVLVVSFLAGGTYVGYQRGYADSAQSTNPDLNRMVSEIQMLMEANANITAENDALRKSVSSIAGQTVKIGYIAPDTTTYTATKVFMDQVVQPDINAYASSLGLDVDFKFIILDAQGQAQKHLEYVQKLRSEGVSIFIGAGWSSQGCASLSYANANKMLMMSPSSTSPTLAIARDSFFRMCPTDNVLPPILVDVLWDYGIREVVIIQRGDSWGDGVINLFKPAYIAKGGTVSEIVRYPADTTDFCPSLMVARTLGEEAIARMGGETSKVGVLLLAFDEASQILKAVSQCEILYNLTWFGADSTARSLNITTNAPNEANHIKLYSPLAQTPNSTRYNDLKTRYEAVTGKDFSISRAYLYDAAWVLAKTILETGSDDATRVAAALTSVCENHYGATGWCRLDQYGDRAPPTYDIWYYTPGITNTSISALAGHYYPDKRVTDWSTE